VRFVVKTEEARIDENGKPERRLQDVDRHCRCACYRCHQLGLDSTGVTFTVDNPTDVPIRIETINLTIYVNETVFGRCFQSFIPKLQHVNPGAKGRAFYVHVPYWLAYSDILEKNGTHSLKITGEVTASATYLFITVHETYPIVVQKTWLIEV